MAALGSFTNQFAIIVEIVKGGSVIREKEWTYVQHDTTVSELFSRLTLDDKYDMEDVTAKSALKPASGDPQAADFVKLPLHAPFSMVNHQGANYVRYNVDSAVTEDCKPKKSESK